MLDRLPRWPTTALLVVAAVALGRLPLTAGQAKPPATPPRPAAVPAPDRPVPFHVGEVLTYDVSWSNYLTAGSVSLTVKERRTIGANRAAYYLVAEGQPGSILRVLYPLYYKLDALLDTSTLQPIEASTYSSERGRVRVKTTTFLPNGTSIDYEVKTTTDVHERLSIPPYSQDPLSCIFVLRALPLLPSQTTTIPITDGGETFRMRVQVGGRESVKTPGGLVTGLRITPVILDAKGQPATDRKFTLWLSDDARRLPLRFEASLVIGSFVLTLTHATP